jgi:microcystin-dependent protein
MLTSAGLEITAMPDPFVGQIMLFPFNFAPTGFAMCQGQLLPIAQNTALFSLLRTQYGGDGKTTFALPDLRGRVSLGSGQGPGLTHRVHGSAGGTEAVTLTTQTMSRHTHALAATSMACHNGPGNTQTPAGNLLAAESTGVTATYASTPANASMHAGSIAASGSATVASTGSGVAHENRQPYLAMNYCIALQGIFPQHP